MKMILETENKEDEKRVHRFYRLLKLDEIEISDKRNKIKNFLKSVELKRKRVKKISIPSQEIVHVETLYVCTKEKEINEKR